MKLLALRNNFKRKRKDPDYKIYELENLSKSIGIMYRKRDRSGLGMFNIYLFDRKEEQ